MSEDPRATQAHVPALRIDPPWASAVSPLPEGDRGPEGCRQDNCDIPHGASVTVFSCQVLPTGLVRLRVGKPIQGWVSLHSLHGPSHEVEELVRQHSDAADAAPPSKFDVANSSCPSWAAESPHLHVRKGRARWAFDITHWEPSKEEWEWCKVRLNGT